MKATIEKQKNKVGRPEVVFTDAQLEELKILAPICTLQQIADYFGISIETFKRLKARDEEVLSIYKKAKIKAKAMVGGSLMKKALAGDTTAAIFYMKTQGGWKEPKDDEEDKRDNKLEITVSIAKDQNVKNLKRFDELKSNIVRK